MKKTLHIIPLSRRAGIELMFINFLKKMKEEKPEYIERQMIFALSLSSYFKDELDKLGVTYFVATSPNNYKFKVGGIFLRILSIKKIIKEYGIEIVYGQNIAGNFNGALVCFGNKKLKLVCHEHGASWTSNTKDYIITLFWTKMANKIICNSNAAKILLNKRYKVGNQKMVVVYNGVPKVNSKVSNKDKYYMLYVGRLDFVKSPVTILKAMPYIVKEIPNIQLDILGDGKLQKSMEEFVDKNKLQDNVNFKGNVENVTEYMAKATLLVVPSMREAFGNVIVEAALQCTPSIGTNVDGIAEVIKHKETGVLIDPELAVENKNAPKVIVDPSSKNLMKPKQVDPTILANEILSLLKSDELGEMGSKAKAHVEEKFSFNLYFGNILKELYDFEL